MASRIFRNGSFLPSAGTRLDRYELLRPVARGGMGVVWLARGTADFGFEKPVAVKTILPQHANNSRFRDMFLDEARIASLITHPNVVQVLDLGEAHGVLYQVMEWVDGDSLRSLVEEVSAKGQTIPPAISLQLMAGVCGGLHAAHELRSLRGEKLDVVHRDVSPQNILITAGGVSKLADFGIAKAKGRISGDTTSGALRGKIRYMAPEQAMSSPAMRACDIWAIGAVLYELVAHRRVFEEENDVATLLQLVQTPPELTFPNDIPEALVAIISRALRPHPKARYATAAELGRALELCALERGLVASIDDVAEFVGEHLAEDRIERKIVELVERQVAQMIIEFPPIETNVEPKPPRPTLPPTAETETSTARTWLIVGGFGLAGVGLATGVTVGLVAQKKADELDEVCPNRQCPPWEEDRLESTRNVALVSTVGYSVAAVGAVLGVTGLLWSQKSPSTQEVSVRPWVHGTEAGLRGRFW